MALSFPTLSQGQDSRFFGEEPEDPAMRTELEGGYVVTRPRHTRRPRRTWTTGFSELTEADKTLVNNFWDAVKGGSDIWNWKHPVTNTDVLVRFKGGFKWKYTGVKARFRWELQFTVEEA